MNKMNVFSYGYRKGYYLKHPIKFVCETIGNFRAAWHRATRGWAACDVWELGPQFLQIFPEMLRYFEKYHCGVPMDMADEEWTQWLHKMADDIELLQETNWEKQNEYAEEFYRVSEETRRTERDENGALHITWSDEPNYNVIKEKYFARCKELNEQWYIKAEEVFCRLSKMLPALWD